MFKNALKYKNITRKIFHDDIMVKKFVLQINLILNREF